MTVLQILVVCLVWFMPGMTHAYIGPGAGLAAIGSLLALVAAVLLTIVGFIWFPLQRLVKKLKKRRNSRVEPIGTEPAREAKETKYEETSS